MERPLRGLTGVPDVFRRRGNIFIAGAAVREGNLRPRETPAPGEYDVRVL